MSESKKMNVPEGYATLVLDLHRTSFAKRVEFTEIGADKNIDRKVISSGAKLMINEEIPKWFRAPIVQAIAMVTRVCVRFGERMWLVPLTKYDEVIDELTFLQKRFVYKKRLLKLGYADRVEEHAVDCDNNPDLPDNFGDIIRQQHRDWNYVDRNLVFEFAVDVDVEKTLAYSFLDDVAREAKDHYKQILKTAKANAIANKEARDNFTETSKGKVAGVKITKKNVNRLDSLRERMESILLMEPKAIYVMDVIDDFHKQCPPPYDNKSAERLIAILHMLADKEYFLEMSEVNLACDDRERFTLDALLTNLSSSVKVEF